MILGVCLWDREAGDDERDTDGERVVADRGMEGRVPPPGFVLGGDVRALDERVKFGV